MPPSSFPLAPIQQGILYESLLSSPGEGAAVSEAGGPGIYLLQIVLHLEHALELDILQKALQVVSDRHEILRCSLDWQTSGEARHIVHDHAPIPLQSFDLRGIRPAEQRAEIERFLISDRRSGIDLQAAPLMRCTAFHLAEASSVLILTIYHAIFDVRSFMILLKELFKVYDSTPLGRTPALPELLALPEPPTQYREYVEWMAAQDFSKSRPFWRSHLQGIQAPTPLDSLTSGFRRIQAANSPNLEDYRRYPVELDPAFVSALSEFARQHDLTLNTLFQAAWGLLLYRHTAGFQGGKYGAQGSNGAQPIVFGATRSCQRSALDGRTAALIGPVLNTVPVVMDANHEIPLLECLSSLRRQWIEMRLHENTPLAQVSAWSEIPPGTPLFHTFCNFESQTHTAFLRQLGPEWNSRSMDLVQTAPYPLIATMRAGDQPELAVAFDLRQFDEQTIAPLPGRLLSLLADFTRHPQRRLGELDMLSPDERHQVLVEWNSTRIDFNQDWRLQARFEAMATAEPDRLAVVEDWIHPNETSQRSLTYAELNARANRLAHHLIDLGVGPEERVGVCLERSLELQVAFLAILKAGGVYVPLDPDYPPERIAFMISDCRPRVVLSHTNMRQKFSGLGWIDAGSASKTGTNLLEMDLVEPALPDYFEINPSPRIHPLNLAYIVYTSGSTGQPKGVMLPHRALFNLIEHLIYNYTLVAADRFLFETPISFDPAVYDLIVPLIIGGSLVMAPPGKHKDPAYLVAAVQRWEISIWHLSTAILALCAEQPGFSSCKSVRCIVTGGESMPPWLPPRLAADLNGRATNGYGPTETCVRSTMTWLDPDGAWPFNSIGSPVPNHRIYILDEWLNPQPVGLEGEIYIGGAGIARGYLDQPALTADRFIPDPFGDPANGEAASLGERLYRTGDLGRYHPDGSIEFLGRIDSQVKLGGVRMELEEIERQLETHPDVRYAAVLLRRGPGGPFLAAFVEHINHEKDSQQLAERQAPQTAQQLAERQAPLTAKTEAPLLKAYLRQRLPESMIPSVITIMSELPRMVGGKIDRQVLREILLSADTPGISKSKQSSTASQEPAAVISPGISISQEKYAADGSHTSPISGYTKLQAAQNSSHLDKGAQAGSDLENLLSQIFAHVLGRSQLSPNDDFFELGGHSLLVMKAAARINDLLSIELPLRAIFEHPTPARLAAWIQIEQKL